MQKVYPYLEVVTAEKCSRMPAKWLIKEPVLFLTCYFSQYFVFLGV
jgi:hypothetical protein